ARGARLVAFGETWLPGYPASLDLCPGAAEWDSPGARAIHARLRANSLVVPGPETARLRRPARAHGRRLVMGGPEGVVGAAGHGTLYANQMIFGSDGALLSNHRKLVPTHAERLAWGQEDGGGLEAVETACGRVGTLLCWEHWMPLARQAM